MLSNVHKFLHYFAKQKVQPISLTTNHAHNFPNDFLHKVKEMGISISTLSKPSVEKDIDALGHDHHKQKKPKTINQLSAIASEELAWDDTSFLLSLPGPKLGRPPLQFISTSEQRERFMGVFTKNAAPRFGAYRLTKPSADSDIAGIHTRYHKNN